MEDDMTNKANEAGSKGYNSNPTVEINESNMIKPGNHTGVYGYKVDDFRNGKYPYDGLLSPVDLNSDNLIFYLPRYGVEEYINDRTIWQKQLYTIGGEQGWFYFKVFFNFNTNYGLLGGLLAEKNKEIFAKHSAIAYLASIEKRYKQEQIPHRMLALYKFGAALKAIQSETPWIIKGINGLDQINGANINEFGKLKSVELVMNTETTDMRIGTLLDLYKYSCYDSINCKEIIPANLRKFEMTVLCFHVPIKGYQTKIYSDSTSTIVTTETQKTKRDGTVKTKTSRSRGDTIDAKTTFMRKTDKSVDPSNMMSFKMFSFRNCEISSDTLDGTISGSLSNETAFNLGGQNVKITYERVYEHRMNEFGEFFMGDNGFLYNEIAPSAFIGTGDLYENAKNKYKINETEGQNLQHKRYSFIADKRTLYEFTDGVIRDANIDATSWGDLNAFSVGRMGKDNLGTRFNTPYLNAKLNAIKEGSLGKNVPTTALRSFTTGGFNLLSDWINGTIKKNNPTGAQQNRTGVGKGRTNTEYFKNKLTRLDDGVVDIVGKEPNQVQNRTGVGAGRKNTGYFNSKIAKLDDGVVDIAGKEPNQLQNRTGVGGSRINTEYFNSKIAEMKDKKVEFSKEIETDIDLQEQGWTIQPKDYKQNRKQGEGGRTNTEYFNTKLHQMDDGTVYFSGDEKPSIQNTTNSKHGNLHDIQEKLNKLRNGTLK